MTTIQTKTTDSKRLSKHTQTHTHTVITIALIAIYRPIPARLPSVVKTALASALETLQSDNKISVLHRITSCLLFHFLLVKQNDAMVKFPMPA